jgi:predicted nucleic acid-binding protein
LSETASASEFPSSILVDADVLFSYLVSDELSTHAEKLLERADRGLLKLRAASEVYDDIISALRTENIEMDVLVELLGDLRKLPYETLPTTLDIASEAMTLYAHYGGSRKLHYFDSFHVATAKVFDLPLVTSDRFILRNKEKLGIAALDLRKI